MHRTSAGSAALVVESAFAAAVELRCLGPSKFVGRSYRPLRFLRVLERLRAPTHGRVLSC
ncbi:MAG: hypothetical protein AVDCRST_MAG66-298 [uncultured Pseudonocardia sp.]|uniref:Uncharacterized protein n=1 Tax=uncultured Pseudonocardia sp. TaxID=211455 RepID=A0A6J4N651_9PSEU|nr:MAG: hypothetical protein AVDCRST_MAG66-298 [uncultured Pseudonocardia sp.]